MSLCVSLMIFRFLKLYFFFISILIKRYFFLEPEIFQTVQILSDTLHSEGLLKTELCMKL